MAKTNGKNKGSTFERKIANLLSDKFASVTGVAKGFTRNSDSGSFFGGTNMSRIKEYNLDLACFGDLKCPNNFKYSVECKHYKTAPSFNAVFSKEVTQWDTWIKQAAQDAENSKKKFLLIIKYNNVPEFVFVNEKLSLDEVIHYKGYYAYPLSAFLEQDVNMFFEI
jgi:hypothetical protein